MMYAISTINLGKVSWQAIYSVLLHYKNCGRFSCHINFIWYCMIFEIYELIRAIRLVQGKFLSLIIALHTNKNDQN